ncbi:hypothetical protein NZL82_16870 [Sphingomonas sanguinis]|uniref:hypothetical protein n=1 Tax=Sphingomonas sp. LC-1 TaxID=3110957 RepID=UPI0021BA3DB3|nr:hypothetical protein [Sphingomonas sp. LC-1]MCT8003549.1 hypothetical protein [Sphingomonas sp. LC-1]
MRKTILILAAAVAAVPAVGAIASEGEQRFVHEGSTYVYTRSTENGHAVIEGRRYPGAEPFRFVVKGHRVTGTTGNTQVAFTTDEARGALGAGVETSAR